jgi:hypothetical protein
LKVSILQIAAGESQECLQILSVIVYLLEVTEVVQWLMKRCKFDSSQWMNISEFSPDTCATDPLL